MLWSEILFGVKKPIIAMLHLDPLPGDPRFRPNTAMEEIVEHARADLQALQEGGVDGVLISNEFSLPYERQMNFVTPAAMAYVVGRLKQDLRVPFGVDCISDGRATIELAAAVEGWLVVSAAIDRSLILETVRTGASGIARGERILRP